jgi:hypothetical protein
MKQEKENLELATFTLLNPDFSIDEVKQAAEEKKINSKAKHKK